MPFQTTWVLSSLVRPRFTITIFAKFVVEISRHVAISTPHRIPLHIARYPTLQPPNTFSRMWERHHQKYIKMRKNIFNKQPPPNDPKHHIAPGLFLRNTYLQFFSYPLYLSSYYNLPPPHSLHLVLKKNNLPPNLFRFSPPGPLPARHRCERC